MPASKRVGSGKLRAQTATGLRVTFRDDKEFTSRRRRDFKRILTMLKETPGKIAEIECESEKEAKAVQRGFHSSGTGRKLKSENITIKTSCIVKPKEKEFKVQISLIRDDVAA